MEGSCCTLHDGIGPAQRRKRLCLFVEGWGKGRPTAPLRRPAWASRTAPLQDQRSVAPRGPRLTLSSPRYVDVPLDHEDPNVPAPLAVVLVSGDESRFVVQVRAPALRAFEGAHRFWERRAAAMNFVRIRAPYGRCRPAEWGTSALRRALDSIPEFESSLGTLESTPRVPEVPKLFRESHPGESNSRPAAYKAAALPTELGWRGRAIGRGGKNVCRSILPVGAGG